MESKTSENGNQVNILPRKISAGYKTIDLRDYSKDKEENVSHLIPFTSEKNFEEFTNREYIRGYSFNPKGILVIHTKEKKDSLGIIKIEDLEPHIFEENGLKLISSFFRFKTDPETKEKIYDVTINTQKC